MKKNLTKVLVIIAVITLIVGAKVYADYILNASDVQYTKSDSSKVSVKVALDDLYTIASNSVSLSYTRGQLVKYNNEEFYVLNEAEEVVELFAKTNLYSGATSQINVTYSSTKCKFSSTNYWSSTSVNLNNVTGCNTSDVMGKVNTYVQKSGAISGRLLTYNEANTLKNDYPAMIFGYGNTAQSANGHGYEYYWLGSLSSSTNVYYVNRRIAVL
ncbi:MAG: hypothetical protein IJ809_02305 [Clostridia bacterium]|nr:hypothetical protein [Clostridia bacterium]